MVDESFVPSAQQTSKLYCRLSDFKCTKAKEQIKSFCPIYIQPVGQPAVTAPSKQVLREVLSKNWKGSLALVLKGGKEEGLG